MGMFLDAAVRAYPYSTLTVLYKAELLFLVGGLEIPYG
jgi:hypothetical protein